jgi:hypothetical protein
LDEFVSLASPRSPHAEYRCTAAQSAQITLKGKSMKNRFHTRLGKIALCLSMAAALAACGHSAPSESDAKAAIKDRLGDCEYFKVTDFEKVNGRQLDDTDCRVDVKYTAAVDPAKYSDKLRDFQNAFYQIKDLRDQYGKRMDELNAVYHNQVDQNGNHVTIGDIPSDVSNNDPELVRLKAESLDIANRIKKDNNDGMTSFVNAIHRNALTCMSVTAS